MKTRLLDFLVCPACAGALTCSAGTTHGDEIMTGQLVCQSCNAAYPIRRGIPRLLPETILAEQQRTAEAFGWEWQEFRQLHTTGRYREQFQDWIHPIQPDFFADKVVLDAGCGMGRFAMVSAEFGAREVLAVDVSQAVEAAADNARDYPTVHVIQADIFHLPFPRRSPDGDPHAAVIDFAYSIGVLHHLPDPEGGFAAISQHLKDDGALFAWVYGRENNDWIVRVVNPIRESVSSRLPRRVLYALSLALALPLQVILKLLYSPRSTHPAARALRPRLPYRAYLTWLAGFGLRHNHHVIFDHLVAPTAYYIPRADFAAWFERAGFEDVTLSWRNQNSWRGFGRLPARIGAAQSS
jgi:uncharacterized protein YbaR (Trm112 family)/ubiquinone/menaquinone biosynthesis C-methylase UbiE